MQKVLIISDTHGNTNSVYDIIEKESDANALIFLGDGIGDINNAELLYPNLKFYKVDGNCDFVRTGLYKAVCVFEGVKVLITHGHNYHVKYHLSEIIKEAKMQNTDIAMFGHTHCPFCEVKNDITLFNPGAVEGNRQGPKGRGYGILYAENNKFTLEHFVL